MPSATRIATAAIGTTTATAIVPAWVLLLDPELPVWMEAPLDVADAAASVLEALAEVVMVSKTSDVLVVPSCVATTCDVRTLVVNCSEDEGTEVAEVAEVTEVAEVADVTDVTDVGAAVVVVSLETVGDVVLVSGAEVVVVVSDGVVVGASVVVVVGAAVVVVSAMEVEVGLAVELEGIALVGVVPGAVVDVDGASSEADVVKVVPTEVILLDIVNDVRSGCLDDFLIWGAMLAGT